MTTADLYFARKLDVIAKHRNSGFFKTIGRTDTVIALDDKIQKQEMGRSGIAGFSPFPYVK